MKHEINAADQKANLIRNSANAGFFLEYCSASSGSIEMRRVPHVSIFETWGLGCRFPSLTIAAQAGSLPVAASRKAPVIAPLALPAVHALLNCLDVHLQPLYASAHTKAFVPHQAPRNRAGNFLRRKK
jgi:hypothetical protein